MVISSSLLYPLVQDLTNVEYSCLAANTNNTIGNALTSINPWYYGDRTPSPRPYTLKDLAIPATAPGNVPPKALLPSPQEKKQTHHQRGHSPFGRMSSYLFMSLSSLPTPIGRPQTLSRHKRSQSAPSATTRHSLEESYSILCGNTLGEERVRVDKTRFEDTYVLTRQLYRCSISTVWECVHREEGTRHCVKIIDRRQLLSRADENACLSEIAMLTSLQIYQSSNLVRLVTIREDSFKFYVVTELIEKGNLATLLSSSGQLSEEFVQRLAKSLLEGVNQLHSIGICHNDLQPENLLLDGDDDDAMVVLCDFGSASYVESTPTPQRGRSRYGNLLYAPPERMKSNKPWNQACDMWSVGVILYQCLSGQLPFSYDSSSSTSSSSASRRLRLKEKICGGNFDFSDPSWQSVSRSSKQFLSSLLHPDPSIRMTVSEALNHPWLVEAYVNSRKETIDAPPRRRSLVERLFRKREKNCKGGNTKKKAQPTLPPSPQAVPSFEDLCTASTLSSMGSFGETSSSPRTLSWRERRKSQHKYQNYRGVKSNVRQMRM